MKYPIATIVLFLFVSQTDYAQKLKADSLYKTRYGDLMVKAVGTTNLSVFSPDNKYMDRVPTLKFQDAVTITMVDNSGLYTALEQAFGTARITALLPERNLVITYYISPQGNMTDVAFLIHVGTDLEVNELAVLAQALKENLAFNVKPFRGEESDFYVVSQNILFRRILDKTLK